LKTIVYEVTDYLCDDCETELHTTDGGPYVAVGDNYYCGSCAVKRRLLEPMSWLAWHGMGGYSRATYKDGVITAYQKCGKGYRKDEFEV
jgi:hypothetical protein